MAEDRTLFNIFDCDPDLDFSTSNQALLIIILVYTIFLEHLDPLSKNSQQICTIARESKLFNMNNIDVDSVVDNDLDLN